MRLVARFSDDADPSSPAMFQCHLLRHEDNGMVAQFVVIEPGQTASAPSHQHDGRQVEESKVLQLCEVGPALRGNAPMRNRPTVPRRTRRAG
jgi:Multicopper oxidase